MIPLCENDTLKCPHNGQVMFLPASDGMDIDGAKLVAITEGLGASIVGCTNYNYPCVSIVKTDTGTSETTKNSLPLSCVENLSQWLTNAGTPVTLQGQAKADGIWDIK